MSHRSRFLLALIVFALPFGVAFGQDANTVTGRVIGLTADDLSNTRAISSAEGRYAVRVNLDSTQGVVLGFGDPGKALVAQRAMFDLLVKAMENQWTVTLRTRRESGNKQSHARILAVTVKPYN